MEPTQLPGTQPAPVVQKTTSVSSAGIKDKLGIDKKTTIENGKESAQEKSKASTFKSLLKSMEPEIKRALPKQMTVERMMRICLTAYSSNSQLQECDPLTIIGAIMQAAQLGLEVNTALGEAYVIPYYNGKNKRYEAQFQIGYKGELSLAYRTGEYRMIGAYEVYENDDFQYEYGLSRKCRHIPARKPNGDPIYYYSVYETINGGVNFCVMSKEQIDIHAKKYSQSLQRSLKEKWNSSIWEKQYDQMAKKTVLKELLNYAPKSIEYARNIAQDGSIKSVIDADMSTIPSHIDWDSLQLANADKIEEKAEA